MRIDARIEKTELAIRFNRADAQSMKDFEVIAHLLKAHYALHGGKILTVPFDIKELTIIYPTADKFMIVADPDLDRLGHIALRGDKKCRPEFDVAIKPDKEVLHAQ